MASLEDSVPFTEEQVEKLFGPDANRVCGVPIGWCDVVAPTLPQVCRRQLRWLWSHMAEFQQKHDKLVKERDALQAMLTNGKATDAASLDELTPEQYRAKVVDRIKRIAPELYADALEANLRKHEPSAIRTLTDLLGLAAQGKADAIDDRAPTVTFEFASTEQPDGKNPGSAKPKAGVGAASPRRPNNTHSGVRGR